MVGVDTLVDHTGHYALAGISGGQPDAFMDFVETDSGFCGGDGGLEVTGDAHGVDGSVACHDVGRIDRDHAQGDIAAHGEHAEAGLAQVVGGATVGKFHKGACHGRCFGRGDGGDAVAIEGRCHGCHRRQFSGFGSRFTQAGAAEQVEAVACRRCDCNSRGCGQE